LMLPHSVSGHCPLMMVSDGFGLFAALPLLTEASDQEPRTEGKQVVAVSYPALARRRASDPRDPPCAATDSVGARVVHHDPGQCAAGLEPSLTGVTSAVVAPDHCGRTCCAFGSRHGHPHCQ